MDIPAGTKMLESNAGSYKHDEGEHLFYRAVAKLVKARDFDSRIRKFESCRPCHIYVIMLG